MTQNFHAIVRFDRQGELVCFCSYEDYLRGQSECRGKYNCAEAMIEVTVLPNSRPSEQGLQEVKKAGKEISKTLKKAAEGTNRIKQGITVLEKAVKGSRFRI